VAAPGVLGNDSGSPLTAALVAGPASGLLSLQPDGSFTYTPASGFTGSVEFTYQATDGETTSGAATVTIHVHDTTAAMAKSLTLVPTYRSIGVYANFAADTDADASATLEYRVLGSSTWLPGMAMSVDRRSTVTASGGSASNPFVNQWRASLIMLSPGTTY